MYKRQGYIYAAMAFSLAVEALNIRARGKRTAARALKAQAKANAKAGEAP